MRKYQPQRFENILPISFEIDREYLLDVANKLRTKDFFYKGEHIPNYRYAHYTDASLKYFLNHSIGFPDMGLKYRSSFVFLQKGTILPWHKDKNNKCAFIWVLNEDRSCVEFRDPPSDLTTLRPVQTSRKYVYKDAIIDTQKEHRVKIEQDRILFKVSILNHSFGETCSRYGQKFGITWSDYYAKY